MKTKKYIVSAILVFVCILAVFLILKPFKASAPAPTVQVRVNSPEYKFINPLLFSDNAKSATPFAKNLNSIIQSSILEAKTNSSVNSISVYYRDLNTSQWTGVDENVLYKPSSLLKVLAMMAAFKVAEDDSSILQSKLYYRKAVSTGIYYEGDKTKKDGYYTLTELIDTMIKYSDNDAFLAIVSDKKINDEFLKTYIRLQLPPEGLTSKGKPFMSPKAYATLFRILYNSTFFSWNVSEQALKLLSQTTFDKGLVAGVPSDVIVANKFGENLDELHDCGIIYYPGHPYLLCVMTKGKDLPVLESVIAGISKEVYEYVNSNSIL